MKILSFFEFTFNHLKHKAIGSSWAAQIRLVGLVWPQALFGQAPDLAPVPLTILLDKVFAGSYSHLYPTSLLLSSDVALTKLLLLPPSSIFSLELNPNRHSFM
jgi:hypothetical protein